MDPASVNAAVEASWLQDLRRLALPWLRTHPSLRLWLPSCGSGADALALAAMLIEEGLERKARVYATEAQPGPLSAARAAGGPEAARRLVFYFEHNLVTDASPNEFQAVLCRGALAGLNTQLQRRVAAMLLDSLAPYGVLALSPSDPLEAFGGAELFELEPGAKIYRKAV
jgi:chemotaxis protein methyltransferase CheR